MPSVEQALEWRGFDLVDRDGDKVGRIEEIYLDQETDQPEWALVNTGLFGARSTFVPLAGAEGDAGQVRVPFPKSHVKDAPSIDPGGELSQEEEARLYSHYGMDYSESRSDTGLPEGQPYAPIGPEEGPAPAGTTPGLRERAETRGADPQVRRQADEPAAVRSADPEADRPGGGQDQVRLEDRRTTRPRLKRYVVTEVVTASGSQEVEREEIPDSDVEPR